jgi:abnormal spindle-like microcephaly-associated protein
LQSSSFSRLRDSLKDVCSFDDFKQRMSVYLSLGTCGEIFQVMTQVTKVCFHSSTFFFLCNLN